MLRVWLGIRIAAFGLIVALLPAPALAVDPFVLFLLRMLRDQAISSSIESGISASQQHSSPEGTASAPSVAPPSTTEAQRLKRTIDESFVHLGPQQREELHASLMRILNDPKNATERLTILTEFHSQALALRESHRHLSSLSESDMRSVAAGARIEYERLPPEQRQQLLQALQQGVPGMPRALHDLMLAEFRSVPAAR